MHRTRVRGLAGAAGGVAIAAVLIAMDKKLDAIEALVRQLAEKKGAG